MIDDLIKTLSSQLSPELQSKADVKPSEVSGIMDVVQKAVGGSLTKQLTSGDGLSAMMNLFSNKPNNSAANGLQNMLSNDVVSGLVSKLGFDKAKSEMISSLVVPVLVGLITKRNSQTPDNDPSPLLDLFGDKGGGLGSIVGKLGGLFK